MKKFNDLQYIKKEYEKKSYEAPQLKEIGSILKDTKSNNSGSREDGTNPAGHIRYS